MSSGRDSVALRLLTRAKQTSATLPADYRSVPKAEAA